MRTVIFDLDGTLVDSSADLIAAANACFDRPLLEARSDAATAFRGGRAMLRLGLSRRGGPWTEAEVDAAYPRLLAAYEAAIDVHTRPYPGAVDAVARLRSAGVRTGICTNKPQHHSRLLLGRLGLADLFHAMVGADTLAVRKPDPAPYRLAVEQAGGRHERSLLVGDTDTDRNTARAAGVPCVLVTFGPEGRAVADLAPEALLDGYADLDAIVTRLLG
jgi:phosphoglycolate phosphatase